VDWRSDDPYFLLLVALERKEDGTQDHLILDVGETGWATTYADWLRRPAEWYLCEKDPPQRAVVGQMVYAGEQPYYVKRNIGQMELGTGRYRQVEVFGIGKKVPAAYGPGRTKRSKVLVSPERTDRVWVLPHGLVCGGEDVEKMALAVVSTMEWQAPPELPPGVEQLPDGTLVQMPETIIEGSAVDVEVGDQPDHRERDAEDRPAGPGDDGSVPGESVGLRGPRGDHPRKRRRDARLQLGTGEDQ
jgi:hypothetical protein